MDYYYPKNITAHNSDRNYQVNIDAYGFPVTVDEPVASGGGGKAPDPGAHLLMALGACTCITLKMYAQRKGWPMEDAIIEMNMLKTGEPGEKHTVYRWIELKGELDDTQRSRLLEIANHCPIHRLLRDGMNIITVLKPAEGRA